MGDNDKLAEPQSHYDCVQIRLLILGGLGIAKRLVGGSPPEKIKSDDPAL
jgi:hypothetical protein